MNEIKSRYSATELADMKLSILPSSKVAIRNRADRESWPYSESTGVGGTRREYEPPAPVLRAIKEYAVKQLLAERKSTSAAVAVVPSMPPAMSSTGVALKDWQKSTAEARAAILLEVERLSQLVGREKAIMKVVIMAQDGTLPEHLAQLVPVANAKSGKDGKRTLSRRTIHRWFAEATKNSSRIEVNALAPKDQHAVTKVPEWAAEVLAAYQSPTQPSLAFAVEQVAAKIGMDQSVLYHRARRFLSKMGTVSLQQGRMGARALKNIKPFVRRDSSSVLPAEIYTADGHCFDAEIAHPSHGRPFRPEITGVIDVGTRRYVGWSVDLAESGLAVLDALRHACESCSIPQIFYVDNGSGYRNAMMSAPGVGLVSRLGVTMSHSLPYNSQARGIIERSHQSVWVRAAKQLPTYIGARMDAQAKNKVHKLTRRDIALSGRSRHLMSFEQFVVFCNEQVDAYNNRPHRSLPMLWDEALGKKRHMTPNEAWQAGINAGAELMPVSEQESKDLFRPQKEAKVSRGEVRLFGNIYFSHDLQEYHGEIVRVGYDVHDGERVWLYDEAGRFICIAQVDGNKQDYMPQSAMEKAAETRARGRLRRLMDKVDEVREELDGAPAVLENNPSPTLSIVPTKLREAVSIDLEAPVELAQVAAAPKRPVFMVESERYEWLMEHRDEWTEGDRRFLQQFIEDPQGYAQLRERFELLGIAWEGAANDLQQAV